MTRSRKTITIVLAAIAIVAVLAAAGWYFFGPASSKQPAADNTAGAGAVSALVKTERVQKRTLPIELKAYGEVVPAKVEDLSFPRAAQIARLLVTPGQQVGKGAPLALVTSDPNAQMAFSQASSAVGFARRELKRTQELFALQLATRSQLDNARRALQDAQLGLATQRKLGGELSSATLTAPFDGVVTTISAAQGDRIQPGAIIVQVGRMDALRVRLGIEPEDRRRVEVGMPVAVGTLQDAQPTYEATITVIQDLIDPKSRLIDALADISGHATGSLVPGMLVRATIRVGQVDSWVVPRQAVLADDQGDYVFQVAGGKARRVNVKKTQEAQGLVAVEGPIDPGQPLVVVGNYELQDGMRVREEPAQ